LCNSARHAIKTCAKIFVCLYQLTITDSFRRLPLDVVPKVIRFLLYTQKKLEDKNYTKIIVFDETAVWFDAVGSTTVDRVGVEDVPIASTGHVTVGLAYCQDGSKLKPHIVFKNICRKEENSDTTEESDVNNKPSTSTGFSLPLITLNEESQEESEEEADEDEDDKIEVVIPIKNNNKRKHSLGMTGP